MPERFSIDGGVDRRVGERSETHQERLTPLPLVGFAGLTHPTQHAQTETSLTWHQRLRSIPRGFLGMLVLVVIVESTIERYSSRFTDNTAATWRWSRQAASRDAPRAEILCFGDSLVKFGVLPTLIEKQSGRKACNLAMFLGSPPASYFLLRRAIQAGARPSALIVDDELLNANPLDHPGSGRNWQRLRKPWKSPGKRLARISSPLISWPGHRHR